MNWRLALIISVLATPLAAKEDIEGALRTLANLQLYTVYCKQFPKLDQAVVDFAIETVVRKGLRVSEAKDKRLFEVYWGIVKENYLAKPEGKCGDAGAALITAPLLKPN